MKNLFVSFAVFGCCYVIPAHALEVPVEDATVQNSSFSGSVSSVSTSNNISVEQRVTQLERQLANRSQVDLLGQIQQLQQQVQELRGQLEITNHDLKALQDQQRAQYQDLDQRLSKQGSVGSTAKAIASIDSDKATANPDAPATGLLKEQQVYQAAYDLLRAKKYDKAKVALQKFLSDYPDSSYSVNAHYWLGEVYLLQGESNSAINEFNKVLKGNPSRAKLADATLKIGFAYYDKSNWAQAKAQFQKVQKQYPDTAASQLATARLQEMQQQGH